MKKFGIIAAAFFLPSLVAAQATGSTGQGITTIWGVLGFIQTLIGTALPLIIAIAVIYFIWGIFRYVMAGDDAAKDAAKDKIVYGIIGIFIMISVWGLVNILVNTFNLQTTAPTNLPNPIPTIPGAVNQVK